MYPPLRGFPLFDSAPQVLSSLLVYLHNFLSNSLMADLKRTVCNLIRLNQCLPI